MSRRSSQIFALLTRHRGITLGLGAVAAFCAGISLWFLFELKQFASNVRDASEPTPGLADHLVFWSVSGVLLLVLLSGLFMAFIAMRRSTGNT